MSFGLRSTRSLVMAIALAVASFGGTVAAKADYYHHGHHYHHRVYVHAHPHGYYRYN